ncbi:ictacalcin-like [Scleropages formosus]|uniref:Protein S100 n=1 Tax=Scleropages formosus TaxID=113540 RepID=A0A0N8JZT2_SCLFO|nr:ictacalcin-like [Scleropages formosus]KPP70209.1 ictacalcin-like [Scleropages formosus]
MSSKCGMQTAICALIECFHKYSGKEGDKNTLTKGELKDLLQAELNLMFDNCKDQGKLDRIFKDLDANSDGTVNFQEYIVMVACIATLCCEDLNLC